MSIPTQTHASPVNIADQEPTFPYGWRYVELTHPDGSMTIEQIALTLDDVAHPQVGDQVTHSDLHQRICTYLYNVFRGLLAAFPTAVVLHDVRVAWDVAEIRPHGPDLAVIFEVRERKNWSTFDVAVEGTRPALIVEVTSPETRSIDLAKKVEEYDLVGVANYVIIDLVQRKGQIVPRLLGYRQTPSVYAVIAPDDQGRIWLEPLNCWLATTPDGVICSDATGAPLSDYPELKTALESAEDRIRALEEEVRRLREAS
jgi:hypothetical protein